MKIHTLRCEMLVYEAVADTFAVFEDAHNLAKITPSWLSFQVTSRGPIEMRRGAEITYRIKWLGLPMRWKTLITEYEPPFEFVDEQQAGPYSLWRHRHTFRATERGTLVGDQVDYALPLGPLGEIAHRGLVRRQLVSIFKYRQEQLTKMFRGKARQTIEPRNER